MDLSIYFQAIQPNFDKTISSLYEFSDIYMEDKGFPDWTQADLIIIGCLDERGAYNNEGTAQAPDQIRKFFYPLFPGNFEPKIADLGNILPGDKQTDTYFALADIVSHLVKAEKTVIILGGAQDLTYGNYLGYEKLEQTVNLVSIDPRFDLGEPESEMHSHAFLSNIVLHQPNYLFNFSNIGYQSYFVDHKMISLLHRLHFDTMRLGQVNENVTLTEPIVRNADIVSVDMSSVRMSDAPGTAFTSPNGLYGEHLCQICRYAGMSDKLSSIGFYETNPMMDRIGQTAHLVAQSMWCFIDGYYWRKKEYPLVSKKNFKKFTVFIKDGEHELVFYKSKLSDRWWMDVPFPDQQQARFERHHLVPCSYEDYKLACENDMPDIWWKTYQKLL